MAVILTGVLAGPLGACRTGGGASEDAGLGRGDRPAGTSPAAEPPAPAVQARAEGIPLTAPDLGGGWRDQGAPDTASGPAGLSLLHPCLEGAPGGDGVVAAARSAELLHLEGDAERTVVTAAAVLTDDGRASQLFTRMAGEAFTACVVLGRVNDLADAAGRARTTETSTGPVRPYPGAGVEAVRSVSVVSVSDPGTAARFDAYIHVVAMREGAAVALLVAQSLFGDVDERELAAAARTLGRRLGT